MENIFRFEEEVEEEEGGLKLGGVAFLEKQQLPKGQLGCRLKEMARGKCHRLKRFDTDIFRYPH